MKHPNYVAVVIEGIALPLVHTAWITAVVFTVLNANMRLLAQQLAPMQTRFLRYLFALLVLTPWLLRHSVSANRP
jgi:methyltransferase